MVVAARLLQVAVTLEPMTKKKKSMSRRKAQALKSSGKPRGQTRGSSLLLGTWEKEVPQKPLSLCLLFPVPTPICPTSPCCTEGTPAPPSPRQPGASHPAHCPPSSALDARSFPCSHRGLSFASRALWQQMWKIPTRACCPEVIILCFSLASPPSLCLCRRDTGTDNCRFTSPHLQL